MDAIRKARGKGEKAVPVDSVLPFAFTLVAAKYYLHISVS
jgi:hypothetical protein